MTLLEQTDLIILLSRRLERMADKYADFQRDHNHFDYQRGYSKASVIRTATEIRQVCSELIKELSQKKNKGCSLSGKST